MPSHHARRALLTAVAASLATVAAAAPTITFESRGPGGGGALFSPAFDPHRPNRLHVACDMSQVFRSDNTGNSWETVPFGNVTANRPTRVHATSDPQVSYTVDLYSPDGNDYARVKRTTDGGATWSYTAAQPGSDNFIYYLEVDPNRANRLLATDYSNLYVSNDSGATWSVEFTDSTGNGVLMAGAFFSGDTIWVGTGHGLLVSTDGGDSFALSAVPGLPAGQGIVSFCGAEEGGTVRLWALTAEDWYSSMPVEDLFWPTQEFYRIDWGAGSWSAAGTGLPTGADSGNGIAILGCARNDIDTVWASGQRPGELPMVFRSTNGGANFAEVLNIANNANIATGWAGHQGDRQWSYGGGTTGLGIDPTNPNRAMFSDYGFVHLTEDGGANWRALYIAPADRNPPNAATPQRLSYHSNGLENTTNWRLTWLTPTTIWASYSDIRGTRSEDSGETWGFDYSGHTHNSAYDCVVHPTSGVAYMGTGTRHDMYQTTTLADSSIDAANGGIYMSSNAGDSWTLMRDFGDTVYQLLIDPSNTERMYALVVHSSNGGVWRTDNLSAGTGATWTKLANPPRTQGHPYALRLLADGTLAASYTGRRAPGFTDSSGVFVSTDSGATWADRTHANMHYYTKDLVIDPHDASQNTWYACVWSGWGGPLNENNLAGGLYRSTDRGQSWARIWESARVSSITVSPTNPNEAFVTTEMDGLWWTGNLNDPAPTLERIESFPFRQPERVYFDPAVPNRIWVTSFGGGLRMGTVETVVAAVDGWMLF